MWTSQSAKYALDKLWNEKRLIWIEIECIVQPSQQQWLECDSETNQSNFGRVVRRRKTIVHQSPVRVMLVLAKSTRMIKQRVPVRTDSFRKRTASAAEPNSGPTITRHSQHYIAVLYRQDILRYSCRLLPETLDLRIHYMFEYPLR
ncbi:hypothetical protein T265_09753 [Opisthorchis viverrini]|uniref:Uncharacterized protein n=1 Tax=Opisthorchis viverrini TaxID=6198 RepID=A0A074Z903_OPIVI|nr:hypothetical protein T265_09753 [Opisthorchis viverrini]KER22067.1 hypothetical protein T265_09753 [Opisthorchis viverrini]